VCAQGIEPYGGFPYIIRTTLSFYPLSLLLPRTAQPVGTIPRTPVTEIPIHISKSSIFMSNLIFSPFLNFLVMENDKVDFKKEAAQIRDN